MRVYWNFHMCCTDMQSNTRVFPFTSRGQKTYAEALLRNFLIFFLLNSYFKKNMYWPVIDFWDSIIFRVGYSIIFLFIHLKPKNDAVVR